MKSTLEDYRVRCAGRNPNRYNVEYAFWGSRITAASPDADCVVIFRRVSFPTQRGLCHYSRRPISPNWSSSSCVSRESQDIWPLLSDTTYIPVLCLQSSVISFKQESRLLSCSRIDVYLHRHMTNCVLSDLEGAISRADGPIYTSLTN